VIVLIAAADAVAGVDVVGAEVGAASAPAGAGTQLGLCLGGREAERAEDGSGKDQDGEQSRWSEHGFDGGDDGFHDAVFVMGWVIAL